MLEKTAKFLEVVFGIVLNSVKSLLWMFIVTVLAVLFICSATVAAIYQIATN